MLEDVILEKAEEFFLQDGYRLFRIADFFNYLQSNGINNTELNGKEELFLQVLEKNYSNLKSTKALQSLSLSNEKSPKESIKNILFLIFEESSLKTSNFARLRAISFNTLKEGINSREHIIEKLICFYEEKNKLVCDAISYYFEAENLKLLDFDYENTVEYISKLYIGEDIYSLLGDLNFSIKAKKHELLLNRKNDSSKYNNSYCRLEFLGQISNYNLETGGGYIYDYETRKGIPFRSTEILNDDLFNSLTRNAAISKDENPKNLRIRVIYSKIQNNNNKIRARLVHSIRDLDELKLKIEDFAFSEKWDIAQLLIEQVLEQFPENQVFLTLQKKYPARNVKSQKLMKIREFRNLCEIAKEKTAENDLKKVIYLYIKFIRTEEKTDDAVRDFLRVFKQYYLDLIRSEEPHRRNSLAKKLYSFVVKDSSKLIQNLSNLKDLVFLLKTLVIYDYEIVEKISNILIMNDLIKSDSDCYKSLFLLKIQSLLQNNKYSDADDCIHLALKNFPNDRLFSELLQKNIYYAPITKLPSIINPDSLVVNRHNVGFLNDILSNYDNYNDVVPVTGNEEFFSQKTLKVLLKKAYSFNFSSSTRAKYYLAISKLRLKLSPDNLYSVNKYLAKYCFDIGWVAIKSGKHPDIIRFYLYLLILLKQEKTTFEDFILYIGVGNIENKNLLNLAENNISLDEILRSFMKDIDYVKWNSIFNILSVNSYLASRVISVFYKYDLYRQTSLDFLEKFTAIGNQKQIDVEKYIEIWNKAITKREKEIYVLKALCSNLNEHRKIETFFNELQLIQKNGQLVKDWYCSTDNLLQSEISNLLTDLDKYICNESFKSKDSLFNRITSKLDALVYGIMTAPTYVSYEIFLPILKKTRSLLQDSFNSVLLTSEPVVTIKLLTENVVILESCALLQFSVSTDIKSAPVYDISLQINNSSNLSKVDEIGSESRALFGGEKLIIRRKIYLSEEVLSEKNVSLTVRCSYTFNDNKLSSNSEKFNVKIYSQNSFIRINNPYIAGPVILDPKMFFGRNDFINNIANSIENTIGKQVLIFGQKRSGKSSVLEFLKRRLENSNKFFCVAFSLGEIISNLSEVTLFHKILNTIVFKLEELDFDGYDVPSFSIPNIIDFENEDPKNPLNTFIKYLKKFKLSFVQVEDWKDKHLVVMIDEFTYIYSLIKKGIISDSFMTQWKAVTQNSEYGFSSVLIGQDVVPSFKREPYARNAFGVIQDVRLTYLNEKDAKDLVVKPILDDKGNSRFVGESVSKLIDFTSRNPYYIQLFCERLVEFMNSNKLINVTELDIESVADSFINGENALTIDKFDNLIAPGTADDISEIDEKDVLSVLHAVAENTRFANYCSRSSIKINIGESLIDTILKSLVDRDVLEKYNNTSYRIKVNLFQKWLLNHSI